MILQGVRYCTNEVGCVWGDPGWGQECSPKAAGLPLLAERGGSFAAENPEASWSPGKANSSVTAILLQKVGGAWDPQETSKIFPEI